MYKYASSEVYSVTLTTKTPVFIGSGSTIGKKEFFVDRNKIHVLDMDAVMKAVFQNGLINEFQNLMLSIITAAHMNFSNHSLLILR